MNTTDTDESKHVIKSESPQPMDSFWLTNIRAATQGSIAALEDAAKQLVTITSFAQTLYFTAISFGDLKKSLQLLPFPDNKIYMIISFIAPIALWLISLWFAVAVFKARPYEVNLESPDQAKDVFYEIVNHKHNNLTKAHLFLTIGFVALLIDIILYITVLPVVLSK